MSTIVVVDPAAAVARARPRATVPETVGQTLSMAWRALKKMRRNPEQFFDVTIQPLLFTAMFAYLFGGAISGNVHSYLPLLIPGIVAQTVLTIAAAAPASVTSQQRPSAIEAGCSAARQASRLAGSRPTTVTRAPSVRKALAQASPMPREPPAMSACLFESPSSICTPC